MMLSEEPENVEEQSTEEPQRKTRKNLPKAVTAYLKAWIVANKDHPYPDDATKVKMASHFNLTVTQINNWFINNRRRFFKKMFPASEKMNIYKRKRAVSGGTQKKRQQLDSENDASSSISSPSSPGTSMSHEDCQNSDTSESSLQDSAASNENSYSSPYVDPEYLLHIRLENQYPFSSKLALLAAVCVEKERIENLYRISYIN